MNPTHLTDEQKLHIAQQHEQAGRLEHAEALVRQILATEPRCAEAIYLLGRTAARRGHLAQALELIGQARAIQPNVAAYHAAAAEEHNQRGIDLRHAGLVDEAIAAFSKAIEVHPTCAQAYNNLGHVLRQRGRLDESLAAYGKAMELRPDSAHVLTNLGNVLRQRGRLEEAIATQIKAVRLKPDFAEAYTNLGNALRARGHVDEALAAYAKSLELKPDSPEALSNLGNVLKDKGYLDEAIAHHRRAIELKPHSFEAHSNLGAALTACGRLDEAIVSFRRAIEIEPNNHELYSNLVYTLHFHPDYTAQQIVAEHRQWAARFAEPLAAQIRAHQNDRSPERRLRIGYVSPDLRLHPVGRFLLPLLAHHNHEEFEIVCYASVRRPDEITGRLKSYADQWHDILGLSDAEAAEKIRGDRIDVLVDLSLHMAHNRMLLFARKPAPVQATWLGYVGTTGLAAMDYRLSDPYLDPPGVGNEQYVEKTIRLPRSFWCYEASEAAPPVNDLPALAGGHVTFGCFNNFCKVTAPTEELWRALMMNVPSSRLLIHSNSGGHLEQFRQRFAARGVEPSRIEFVASQRMEDYFTQYQRVDIGLDPVPYGGGTTTCDALWMGVPVVTLAGRTAVGRAGMSLLSNLGMPELIAQSPEEYLAIAQRLAVNLPRLAQLRGTLRRQMRESGLMDAQRFAVEIETAYRQMWRNWCAVGRE